MKNVVQEVFKRTTRLAIAIAVPVTMLVVAQSTGAVPYQGANTPPLPSPAFNQYTGVPEIGNESDFFKGREAGVGDWVNNVSSACNNGQEFSLRAYVHNGASQHANNNGSGPSVAHNTMIRVALPGNTEASNFPITAYLSSSNAGSMSDGMSINCNGKTVKLSYITGSAVQVSALSGTQALSDSIVTTGAKIGTMSPDGKVWGCWDQRVQVFLKVKVTDVPDKPKPSEGKCKAVSVKTFDNRRVSVSVTGHVTNATIVGYQIDFGDGTVVNQQSAEHTYAKDGTYTIVGRVQVKLANGQTEWKTAEACTKKVTFKSDKPVPPTPPVTPPTTPPAEVLPNTGTGDVLGIFAATSAAGTLAHKFVYRRFRDR